MLAETTGRELAFSSAPVPHVLAEILEKADVRVNGDRPWDMRIKNGGVLDQVLARGNLGLGEAYMNGEWHAERLDEFFCHVLRTRLTDELKPWKLLLRGLSVRLLNRQSMERAAQVGVAHYDLGNDFYACMLDSRMTYTCGYWEKATTLEEAQEAKLDLICRKLGLRPGMRLLDIGCGWGSLMSYAAEHYGVTCTGISISREQVEWAKRRYKHLPLQFRLQDCRLLDEKFDRIAS